MTDIERARITALREAGNGYGKIAQTLGISINTVKSFCRRNHIGTERTDAEEEKPAAVFSGEVTQCENCGKPIRQIAKRKRKRFCCDKCRNEWWNGHLNLVKRKAVYDFKCPYCGKTFHVYGDKRRKYCSHECYIADRFGGGRRD